MKQTRRHFIQDFGRASGALVLVPVLSRCVGGHEAASPAERARAGTTGGEHGTAAIPTERPTNWDPIGYNRDRGNAGAIPASYHESINGPDGVLKHLGKHLPYVPSAVAGAVPEGFLPIMWGDAEKGYARHPNAAPSDENPEGHWYNWIRIRKVGQGSLEQESVYSAWPVVSAEDSGELLPETGSDATEDGGRNTVYLAALPEGVQPGDTVRIHAHCLTHGEYVDFLEIPER